MKELYLIPRYMITDSYNSCSILSFKNVCHCTRRFLVSSSAYFMEEAVGCKMFSHFIVTEKGDNK